MPSLSHLAVFAAVLGAPSLGCAARGSGIVETTPLLTLSLTEREVSRDSNSQRFELRVTDDEVRYSGPIGQGVRGQHQRGERTLKLSADKLTELLAEIRESWGESYSEAHPIKGGGRFVELVGRLQNKSGVVEISVSGRVSERGGEPRLSERGRGLAAAASSLAWSVKRLLEH